MQTSIKALGAVVALAFSLSANATLIIDSFTTTQTKLIDTTASSGPVVTNEIFAAEALGGYRELVVSKISGDAGLESSIAVTSGKLRFSNEDEVTGVGIVRWDGAGSAGLNGGLGLDLTAYGNSFIVDVTSIDLSFSITVNAYTGGNLSTFTFGGTSIGQYGFNFSSLVGLADLTDVTKLELVMTGPASVDLSIDTVTVPEPASLALVGLSLLGLGVMRRRQA